MLKNWILRTMTRTVPCAWFRTASVLFVLLSKLHANTPMTGTNGIAKRPERSCFRTVRRMTDCCLHLLMGLFALSKLCNVACLHKQPWHHPQLPEISSIAATTWRWIHSSSSVLRDERPHQQQSSRIVIIIIIITIPCGSKSRHPAT